MGERNSYTYVEIDARTMFHDAVTFIRVEPIMKRVRLYYGPGKVHLMKLHGLWRVYWRRPVAVWVKRVEPIHVE